MGIQISGVNNNDKITALDGTIDLLSSSNLNGNLTAPSINIGSNIQLGNAGIITATTLIGDVTGNVTGNVNATSNLLLQIGGSEKFRVGSSGQLGIGGANYGTSGQVLQSAGSGAPPTWNTISGTTINNNTNNYVVTATGTANTLNGEASLTWDGSQLYVNCGNYSEPILINSVQSSVRATIRQTNDANANSGLAIQKRHSSLHPANYWYGDISFEGWDGSGFHKAGLIECVAEGTPANDSMPGSLRFSTNAGGTTPTERLRITSSGAVMINTTNSSSRTLNLKGTFGILSASQTGVLDMSVTDAGAASIGPYVAGGSSLIFKTNASGTGVAERLRIDSTGVARFINSTGELKIASSTNNDSGKIIFQENTTGAWSLEAQRANGYFRILDEYNGNSGSPQERFRITPAGQVSISDDGTTDGLLTIKGNSDATGNPSIRLLDGSDTREASISNTSGDLIISTHGTDNVEHGSIKIHETGFISLSTNAGAGNAARLKVDLVGSMRHMGTSGYYQITVIHNGSGSGNWYSGSGPQRIYPNYIDNRTGYAEFIIEFHPSTSYSGWEEPTFVICNGNTGGLRTGGTVELNTNRRTNGPNNAVFRAYHGQYSWQIYNDGDSDVTGGQREINRNVEHRTSYWIDPSTQSIDYIHSLDSRYNTNVEPLLNQRSFIKIKINKTSNTSHAVQGHPFVCRFVCYSQGDTEWYGYMQYN